MFQPASDLTIYKNISVLNLHQKNKVKNLERYLLLEKIFIHPLNERPIQLYLVKLLFKKIPALTQ